MQGWAEQPAPGSWGVKEHRKRWERRQQMLEDGLEKVGVGRRKG